MADKFKGAPPDTDLIYDKVSEKFYLCCPKPDGSSGLLLSEVSVAKSITHLKEQYDLHGTQGR